MKPSGAGRFNGTNAARRLLIDRDRRSRRVGRIFVVRTEDGLIVKRAGKSRAGNWQLVSDDRAYKPVLWPQDAVVLGQVMWTGRTL